LREKTEGRRKMDKDTACRRWKMKSRFVLSLVAFAIFAFITATAMPIVNAEEIRIASIDDSYINREVTVSGVVASISYEQGQKRILTIDDGSGTIFVKSDSRLFGDFYPGERITVKGIYVGEKMVYADLIYPSVVGSGYKDVTVKELKEFPEYYYADSVRIIGNVTRIELTREKSELTIDDDTGTIDVEYRAEMEDIKIGEEVIVEGKFYRTKIYAFAVKKQRLEPEETAGPSPTPSPTPVPTPTSTPTPRSTSPPPSTPTPTAEARMPPYIIVIIIAVVAVAGVFIAFRVRDWLILRRYGK